jgi:hypothetical protein
MEDVSLLNARSVTDRTSGPGGAAGEPPRAPAAAGTIQPSRTEPPPSSFVVQPKTNWRLIMLRGGLLWLIGIPLPIILILFFLGYLS